MRVVAGILGVGCIATFIAILTGAFETNLTSLAQLIVVGIAFLAYAIGGQPLLEKVAPRFAEKKRSHKKWANRAPAYLPPSEDNNDQYPRKRGRGRRRRRGRILTIYRALNLLILGIYATLFVIFSIILLPLDSLKSAINFFQCIFITFFLVMAFVSLKRESTHLALYCLLSFGGGFILSTGYRMFYVTDFTFVEGDVTNAWFFGIPLLLLMGYQKANRSITSNKAS